MDTSWYVRSFQKEYPILYSHRDDASANWEIHSLINGLELPEKGKVLDLCCGSGRHSRVLAQMGYEVTGVDLSDFLLEEARKGSKGQTICFMQSDMREIPFNNEFDIVFNLFTSFGYFLSDDDNESALRRMVRSAKPGGHVVIDYLNPTYVRENLNPFSKRTLGNMIIEEKRWIDDKFVNKHIIIKDDSGVRELWERVRMYPLSMMKQFLIAAGIDEINVYGNYALTPYSDGSKRMIFHGIKRR